MSQGLAIGRASFQAPEVDGCVVVRYDRDEKSAVQSVVPGAVIQAQVLAVSGVDLDAGYLSLVLPAKKSGLVFIDSAENF